MLRLLGYPREAEIWGQEGSEGVPSGMQGVLSAAKSTRPLILGSATQGKLWAGKVKSHAWALWIVTDGGTWRGPSQGATQSSLSHTLQKSIRSPL